MRLPFRNLEDHTLECLGKFDVGRSHRAHAVMNNVEQALRRCVVRSDDVKQGLHAPVNVTCFREQQTKHG